MLTGCYLKSDASWSDDYNSKCSLVCYTYLYLSAICGIEWNMYSFQSKS